MEMEIMKIFLVCQYENGKVIDVITAKTFEDAYQDTVGLNNGELVVELDKHSLEKIQNITKGAKDEKPKRKQTCRRQCRLGRNNTRMAIRRGKV
ncbi:MAG: hypothetical protein AB1393_13785 [Candidatus Edwardsbacteria bacterium]